MKSNVNSARRAKAAPPADPISITEFLLNKKRAACPVCRLKEPVRSLVSDARKKRESQSDIIDYLKAVHRITITAADFASHISARHEQ